MPDESPDRPFDQAKKILQEQILQNYPNPERRGCPGDAVLKRLASGGLPPENDPVWQHVTHCSPCYGEFLQFRKAFKAERERVRRQQRLIFVSAAAAAMIIAIVLGWINRRHGTSATPVRGTTTGSSTLIAKSTRRPAYLDFGSVTFNRGSGHGKPIPHLTLPVGDLDLKIRLPVGSEDGQYEVQVLRQPGEPPVGSVSGTAKLEGHNEYLTMHINLANVLPGEYYLAFRRGASDWTVLPVQLTK